MDKCVCFDPAAGADYFLVGVRVTSQPVQYLGAFVGIGPDVECRNFEDPLRKIKVKAHHWRLRCVSLEGHILVAKTLLLSCFTHLLNSVFVDHNCLDFLQKYLLEFVWHRQSKVKPSVFVFVLPTNLGGLNIVNVKHFIHKLRAKWLLRIANAHISGEQWAVWAWAQITSMIPASLMPSLRWVQDFSDKMDPFYWSVLSSYAHVNNILLAKTTQLDAPRNLWAVPMNKTINIDFVNAGLIEVGDLPLLNGLIDVAQVTDHLQ